MNTNQQLIERFYTAVSEENAAGLADCYSEDITFYDPAFELLRGEEVRAMWRMLLSRAKDFSLTYSNIVDLEDGYYTCDWVAKYTFNATGNPVVNKGKAHMRIANGKIIEHSDAWSFAKWAGQALGTVGKLFGWLGLFRRRVQNNAKRNLLVFMQSEQKLN